MIARQRFDRRPRQTGRREDGAVMAEYGLLVVLIAAVVAVVLPALGITVSGLFTLPIPL